VSLLAYEALSLNFERPAASDWPMECVLGYDVSV